MPSASTPISLLRHHRPALLGLLVAVAAVVTGVDRDAVTITLCTAALCYLAAAALGRPEAAWWSVPAVAVLVTVAGVLGLPTAAAVGVAALVLLGVGLARRVDPATVTVEALGVVAYGGGALLALLLDERAGLAATGVLLAAHAVWDGLHLRRRIVVAPSLAQFCLVLDVLLGGAAVGVAVL